MSKHIDYYVSLQSPWTFLGHDRLVSMAQDCGASLAIHPLNYGAVFPATGGLPLPKRAPERQAYRLMELKRWREHLDIPITIEPAFFPVNEHMACRLVVAIRETSQEKAVELTGKILAAIWLDERNIADTDVLIQIANGCGVDGEALLKMAEQDITLERLTADTQAAIDKGVFGAPSYVIGDEIFWGQDRLEFVERKLMQAG